MHNNDNTKLVTQDNTGIEKEIKPDKELVTPANGSSIFPQEMSVERFKGHSAVFLNIIDCISLWICLNVSF